MNHFSSDAAVTDFNLTGEPEYRLHMLIGSLGSAYLEIYIYIFLHEIIILNTTFSTF